MRKVWRPALAGTALFLCAVAALAQGPYPLRVEWVQDSNRTGGLLARNDRPVPESLLLLQTQPGLNVAVNAVLPLVAVVPGKSSVRLVSMRQMDARQSWRGFSWQWSSRIDVLGARHEPGARYRLPWLPGHAFYVIQAPGGKIVTHDTPDSRDAIDFALPEGTAVTAARGGIVADTEAGFSVGRADRALAERANYVRVLHEDGTIGLYLHLRRGGVSVTPGQRVEAGSLLGFSGNTGYSSGPHLHFAVLRVERAGDRLGYESVPVRWVAGNPPAEIAVKQGLAVGGRPKLQ